MDMDALKKDVKVALHTLPKELVDVLLFVANKVLAEHREKLEAAFPLIVEYLKPHAMAAMMEISCGMLPKEELEKALTDALHEVVAERSPSNAAHAG